LLHRVNHLMPSGYLFKNGFHIKKFYVHPTEGIYVLYGPQKKTANISFYSINLLLSTTEAVCLMLGKN